MSIFNKEMDLDQLALKGRNLVDTFIEDIIDGEVILEKRDGHGEYIYQGDMDFFERMNIRKIYIDTFTPSTVLLKTDQMDFKNINIRSEVAYLYGKIGKLINLKLGTKIFYLNTDKFFQHDNEVNIYSKLTLLPDNYLDKITLNQLNMDLCKDIHSDFFITKTGMMEEKNGDVYLTDYSLHLPIISKSYPIHSQLDAYGMRGKQVILMKKTFGCTDDNCIMIRKKSYEMNISEKIIREDKKWIVSKTNIIYILNALGISYEIWKEI